MAFEVLSGIYRTAEGNGTYKSAVCVTFVDNEAWLHGLTSNIPPSCVKELMGFIKSLNISVVKYIRKKNNKSLLKIVNIESVEDGISFKVVKTIRR